MNDTNNPSASQQAAYCLAFIGADAMSPLMIALADSSFPYRSEVANCLSILRQTAGTNIAPAVLLLAQCATNKDEYLIRASVEALGRMALSPDISLPPILHALESTKPMVRVAAAHSVARFGAQGRVALPALLRACNDSDVFVRYAATNSLHAITSGPLHD